MERNGILLELHHIGIPVTEPREGERFNPAAGMFTSDGGTRAVWVQYHRFAADSSLHPAIQRLPHLAFKVCDLDRAIEGAPLLLGPVEPFPGYRIAVIDDGGLPVELIETGLGEEELRARMGAPPRPSR